MTDTEKTNEAPNGPSDSKAMLDCKGPAKPLKAVQRKGEPPDLFAMRVWAETMNRMDYRSLVAAANWIQYASEAHLKKRTAI